MVGYIVQRCSSSTTANLQEWQNESGTALASVAANGQLNAVSGAVVTMKDDATPGLVVKRFSSTLNADIMQIQDQSSGVLAFMRNDGSFSAKGFIRTAAFNQWEDTANGGDATTPYQMYNSGAGQFHFKLYVDRAELAAVRPGALNPYNSFVGCKVRGSANHGG